MAPPCWKYCQTAPPRWTGGKNAKDKDVQTEKAAAWPTEKDPTYECQNWKDGLECGFFGGYDPNHLKRRRYCSIFVCSG